MTTVRVILVKTKADYAAAKAHVRALMDAGGHDDEIAAQARLIQDYEQAHFPIADPDPIDALLFRMEQEGIDRRGLSDLLNTSTGRVSEVLSGRRPLSISMIRTLHRKLGISGDILIGTPRKRTSRPSRGTKAMAWRLAVHPEDRSRNSRFRRDFSLGHPGTKTRINQGLDSKTR